MKPLDSAAAGLFYALSRLRGKRVVHPHGAGFRATLAVPDREPRGLPAGVFAIPGTHDAIVRLSRGAGVPGPLPDVLGLAFRVTDAYGPGLHQDALLVSSGTAPVFRHAILPGPRGFFSHLYSSVAPFRASGALYVLGARCTDSGPSPSSVEEAADVAQGRRFEILAARLGGAWKPVAELRLEDRLPGQEIEDLRFNPHNTSDDLRPRGPFMRLRDPAYRGSQAGRTQARHG